MIEYQGYELNKKIDKSIPYIKKGKKLFLSEYICLDTETSWNHDEEAPICWIYQWAFTFNHGLYYGRTPEQLVEALQQIRDSYNSLEKIYVYVHNLPYDFSYLALFFHDAWGDPKVLAYAPHKCFSLEYENNLCFRCSYKLSNDSLDRWSKKLGTRHKKLVDTIDYDVIRYQNSKLTRKDWRYMFYDVIVLDECIKRQMEIYEDDISTIPLTSTAYTRREILESYRPKGKHKYISKEMQRFRSTALTVETYDICREEMSGGITHGDRRKRGKLLTPPKGMRIKHRDFRSHYPTQQRKRLFPMGAFCHYSNEIEIEKLIPMMRKYAILLEVDIANVEIKEKVTLPYLQTSHVVRHVSKGFKFLDDNGRIISYSGTSRVYLDMHELLLVLEQYDCEFIIRRSYISKLGLLPEWLTSVIDKHFKGKSDYKDIVKELKGMHETFEKILDAETNLTKSKNIVNGIYGVSATDPIKVDIKLNRNEWTSERLTIEDKKEKLEEYYKAYNHYMRYQWGVYTTIYARLQLVDLVKLIGYENFIYCDTDSIFYYTNDMIEARIEAYNKQCYDESIEMGAYVTTEKGAVIVYDQFEDEHEDIVEFKFLHAKCYSYLTSDGEMHTTIAGVQKVSKGKVTNSQELGSVDALSDGFVFEKCSGTTAKYIDLYEISRTEGLHTGGGCIIQGTTKTMTCKDIDDYDSVVIADRY